MPANVPTKMGPTTTDGCVRCAEAVCAAPTSRTRHVHSRLNIEHSREGKQVGWICSCGNGWLEGEKTTGTEKSCVEPRASWRDSQIIRLLLYPSKLIRDCQCRSGMDVQHHLLFRRKRCRIHLRQRVALAQTGRQVQFQRQPLGRSLESTPCENDLSNRPE